ncbi:MAG: sulfatase [Pirellulaceae bacterium]|nr:sulfatase [Pirellulaceae bacterium]
MKVPSTAFLIFGLLGILVVPARMIRAVENSEESSRETRPNVLVIMTDEHNFRTLGCYRQLLSKKMANMWGSAVVETPYIDSLAASGAICTSYYATTPVCSPSRAALISGMYPHLTPVNTNNIPLDDNVVTFAEILRRNGYVTGYAGKWHLDGLSKPGWSPIRKFGFEDNRFMFNRGHWKILNNGEGGPRVGARQKNGQPSYSVEGATKETFTTDFLMDRTIDFVKENQQKAFCYMLSLPDPHGPDTVRAPYDTMYKNQTYSQPPSAKKDFSSSPSWGSKQQGNYQQAKYYGMVKCIDDNIGRLIGTLKELGIYDNTILVFTSDHGDLRGEHHRQNKGVPYEASTRVPFLMRYPKLIKSKTIINQALGSIDFLPTLCTMTRVEPVNKPHGRDFTGLLKGKVGEPWKDLTLVRGTGSQKGWLMAVTDRYKLIVSSNDPVWFFDLERDPNEMINLRDHAGYRGLIKSMGAEILNYGKQFEEPFVKQPQIQNDLKWAVSSAGKYTNRQ